MTYQEFPLTPTPAGYISAVYMGAYDGVWYTDQSGIGSVGLNGGTATNYGVYDIDDTLIVSGTLAGAPAAVTPVGGWPGGGAVSSTFRPTVPGGGWLEGWYWVRFTGASSDALFGTAYGDYRFIVRRRNSNLPTLPDVTGWSAFNTQLPDSATGNNATFAAGDKPAIVTRACFGLAPNRISIQNPDDPFGGGSDNVASALIGQATVAAWWADGDPVRARPRVVNFVSQSYAPAADFSSLPTLDGGGTTWMYVLPKTAALVPHADQIFLKVLAGGGTAGSDKVEVYYPNSSTLAESFDNLTTQAGAVSALRSGSSLVWAKIGDAGHDRAAAYAKTAIGLTWYNGVKTATAALVAAGATHFEGPANEPYAEANFLARFYAAFQKAVNDGGGLAIGPCVLGISALTSNWDPFFAELTAIGCTPDGISFHDYNSVVNGDVNVGRATKEAFLKVIANNGFQDVEKWQTEATTVGNGNTVPTGMYHPRRGARHLIASLMLWEQYGVPLERNAVWYDYNHGFWAFPGFWLGSYGGPASPGILACGTLAEECYGKNYHHHLDFGSVSANQVFYGNVYGVPGATDCVASVATMSHLPGSTVTFTVTGTTADLTVSDWRGRLTTVTPSAGRVTVNVDEFGTHLRLPAGVYVRVYSVGTGAGDWGNNPSPSVGAASFSSTLGGAVTSAIVDGSLMSSYTGDVNSVGITISGTGLPDVISIPFAQTISNVKRLIVWCGPYWEIMPGLHAYTVDARISGVWTQQTLKKLTGGTGTSISRSPASVLFGSNDNGLGCRRYTVDPEQWIEVIEFNTPPTCDGVRINVTAASYGGEPDLAAMTDGTTLLSQHGMDSPILAIQQVDVISSTVITLPGDYATEVAADSPNAWYRMEEASGTTMASAVNHPTIDGTFPGGGVTTYGLTGIAGNAVSIITGGLFGGAQVADNALVEFGNVFTQEVWFLCKSSGFPRYLTISASTAGTSMQIDTNNKPFLAVNGGGSNGQVVASSSAACSIGAWNHIVITKNGSTTHLYLNGVDVTVAGTNFTFPVLTSDWQFGQALGTGEGLDELALYPTALSAARVATHYQAGIKPSAPTIVTAPTIEGA